MLQNIILVGLGSMLGGISRYLFSDFIKQILPSSFPFGTFLVNMIGCLGIGILSGWLASASFFTPNHRMLFIVGFCGSFTTFSTFSMDNLNLLINKAYGIFALNVGLSISLGLLLTFIGYSITQR